MTEPSLSIVNASDGRLEGTTVGDTALAVTHDGTGTTFTFTDNGTPFLVLAVRLERSDDGSVTRASLAADGDTIQHRITFDFADDPGLAFSEGKLQAVVSVEGGQSRGLRRLPRARCGRCRQLH